MVKKKVTIFPPEEQQCTCSGDVFQLLEYKGGNTIRNYSLYKIFNMDSRNYIYIMLIEDDPYPVALTKEKFDSFLENPEEGHAEAYNIWMNRYR